MASNAIEMAVSSEILREIKKSELPKGSWQAKQYEIEGGMRFYELNAAKLGERAVAETQETVENTQHKNVYDIQSARQAVAQMVEVA